MKSIKHSINSLCRPTASIPFRILVAVLTLVVVGGAVVGLLRSKQQSLQVHHRKALEISEYGLMQALVHLRETPSWRTGLAKTEYNEGSYKVKLKENSDETGRFLTITSIGKSGTVKQEKKIILRMEISNSDTSWVTHAMR